MLTELQSFNCPFGQYSGTLDYGVPGPPTIFIRLITFFSNLRLKKVDQHYIYWQGSNVFCLWSDLARFYCPRFQVPLLPLSLILSHHRVTS